MDTKHNILLESLVETFSDNLVKARYLRLHQYRWEIWLKQFDFADRSIILAELEMLIIKRFYF